MKIDVYVILCMWMSDPRTYEKEKEKEMEWMSEKEEFLQTLCDEMDMLGIIVTAEEFACFQDKYSLEECSKFLEELS
jgi:hypothetical protein